METNNSFSFQRLMLLGKQSLIINKKMIGISLAGFAGFLFIFLVITQYMSNPGIWDYKEYTVIFTCLFFSCGIIYSSFSFPAFRSKEKSMAYLMLPVSVAEKFTFELLTRIVAFIILMPLLYWVEANLAGALVHHFRPEFAHYKFSFIEAYYNIVKDGKFEFWALVLTIQGILFVFIAPFAGASYFSKSPLLKTMFTFTLIIAGYGLFVYLLVKGLYLEGIHPAGERVLFINSQDGALVFTAVMATAINLCLLAIAWFRLKEREA